MKLLVDIGNTTIGLVFSKEEQFVSKFSLACRKDKVEDEYYSLFRHLLKDHLHDEIDIICVSSVVPSITTAVCNALKRIYKNTKQLIIKPGVKTGVLFKIDNIQELGADLVCDIVALKQKFSNSAVAIDLGTATKFLLLDKDGVFTGCAIAPGLQQAHNSLCNNASLLPEVDLAMPKNVLGKNTFESIKSGSILGHALMVKSMCEEFEKEVGYPLKKIITGGNSIVIKEFLSKYGFIYDS